MKRQVWVVSPTFYMMAAAMLIMSGLSFRYNRILFAIELTLSLLLLLAVFISDFKLHKNIRTAIHKLKRIMRGKDEGDLDRFPLPVTVIGGDKDIIWGNAAFREVLMKDQPFIGASILKIIHPKTLRQIITQDGASIEYMGRDYTVYAVESESNYILYFVDDTYYKQVEKEFRERKPVVCIVVFDNREEIARSGISGEESRIAADIEAVLRDWAIGQMGGFLQRLRNDRFMIITDELHVDQAKKDRFQILDRVRAIKSTGKMSATISIGIGGDAMNASESERKARQALDMALGRGGDQVAVMQKGDVFEFFGGLSKGVEKRDKVRTRVIAASIADQVKLSDQVLIMGHKSSDMDSVGAALGMWAVVYKGLEQPAAVVINEAQTLAGLLVARVEQAYPDEQVFVEPSEALQRFTQNTLVIVVDTHSMDLLESRELCERAKRVVVIDHHRMVVSHIKNADVFYHEPYASSASEMVAEIVQYIKSASIGSVEAQALLAGITLDTKNFVVKTGVRTFEASAFLRSRGADTVEVKKLFANSLDDYREKSQLVRDAEIYKQCAVAVSTEDTDVDLRISAAQAADELLSIQGVQASFVLYCNNGKVNISARSLGDVNVQLILEGFGGGGHFTTAGAQLKDITLLQAKKMLIRALDEKLESVRAKKD